MKFLLFLLVASVSSTPTFNCPNGFSAREAQQCSAKLTSLDDQLEDIDEDDALNPRTLQLVDEYCATFRNCYTPQKMCSFYDTELAQQAEGGCKYHEFFTRNINSQCGQKFVTAEEHSVECTNDLLDVLVDDEDSNRDICSAIQSKMLCATKEIGLLCSSNAGNEFQNFVRSQARVYNC